MFERHFAFSARAMSGLYATTPKIDKIIKIEMTARSSSNVTPRLLVKQTKGQQFIPPHAMLSELLPENQGD